MYKRSGLGARLGQPDAVEATRDVGPHEWTSRDGTRRSVAALTRRPSASRTDPHPTVVPSKPLPLAPYPFPHINPDPEPSTQDDGEEEGADGKKKGPGKASALVRRVFCLPR